MKLRKRLLSIVSAMIMAVGAFGIDANAAGYVHICSTSGGNVKYEFDNIDSTGYTSTDKFKVNTSGSHAVTYTPTSGSSTTVKFLNSAGQTKVSITIPASAPGMPSTLTSYPTFSTSIIYRMKATSSGSTNGYVTINNAYKYEY